MLSFYSLWRSGEIVKTAAFSCRRLRDEGSRQDGKVNRKKEKCKRGTAHGKFKVTFKLLFLLHLYFSLLLDSQWKLERLHSLIFFNIFVIVVLYLKISVYTKLLPIHLN